jgi:hypothetical protein
LRRRLGIPAGNSLDVEVEAGEIVLTLTEGVGPKPAS